MGQKKVCKETSDKFFFNQTFLFWAEPILLKIRWNLSLEIFISIGSAVLAAQARKSFFCAKICLSVFSSETFFVIVFSFRDAFTFLVLMFDPKTTIHAYFYWKKQTTLLLRYNLIKFSFKIRKISNSNPSPCRAHYIHT